MREAGRNPGRKAVGTMKDFYSKENREAAVAQLMGDHAAYVAEQARLSSLRDAGLASIRAATPPEELAQDDLYKARPDMF